MSILLQAVDIRHERRVRLVFTNTLAAGAFGAPAPAAYSIVNVDGKGPDPNVKAALIVSGSANVVELALEHELVKGALYTISAVGVPAVDLTTTPGGSTLQVRWGVTAKAENIEPLARERDDLLYFIDLLWTGDDFQETPLGDLDRVSGRANVTKALQRGAEACGLPWDPTWGGFLREYVDSPSTIGGTLKGSITAQMLRDPRVKSVKIKHEIAGDKTFIYADPVLYSGETAERVTTEVPNS